MEIRMKASAGVNTIPPCASSNKYNLPICPTALNLWEQPGMTVFFLCMILFFTNIKRACVNNVTRVFRVTYTKSKKYVRPTIFLLKRGTFRDGFESATHSQGVGTSAPN